MKSTIRIQHSFKEDSRSIDAGERLRTLIAHAISRGKNIVIDFGNTQVGSPDFLNEGIAKLYHRFAKSRIHLHVKIIGMAAEDQTILAPLIEERASEFEA